MTKSRLEFTKITSSICLVNNVTATILLFFLSEKADDDLPVTPSQDMPDSHGNGVDPDAAALSMAEIASCSYEAR